MILGDLMPFIWVKGNRVGRCAVCGLPTEQGLTQSFSAKFTSQYRLYAGDVLCPRCAPLFKVPTLRSRSWVASQAQFRYLSHAEWLPILLDPPEPPFALYLTREGTKYGFLSLIHRVSLNRERYWLATDWNEVALMVERLRLGELAMLAKRLRDLGVPKAQLLSRPAPQIVAKAIKGGWDGLLHKVETLRGDPLWEVVIYAVE